MLFRGSRRRGPARQPWAGLGSLRTPPPEGAPNCSREGHCSAPRGLQCPSVASVSGRNGARALGGVRRGGRGGAGATGDEGPVVDSLRTSVHSVFATGVHLWTCPSAYPKGVSPVSSAANPKRSLNISFGPYRPLAGRARSPRSVRRRGVGRGATSPRGPRPAAADRQRRSRADTSGGRPSLPPGAGAPGLRAGAPGRVGAHVPKTQTTGGQSGWVP